MSELNKQQYITLCLSLLKHAYLYYECDAPEIQDYEYDKLYRKIVDYEYDNAPVSFSPTQFVGFDHKLLRYENGELL